MLSRRRIALNFVLTLLIIYGALRCLMDTLHVYKARRGVMIYGTSGRLFKVVSSKDEATKLEHTIRLTAVNQNNIPTHRTPKPKQIPPLTVIVNNRSVIPTVPPLPAKVSMVKGNPDICRSSKDLKWIIYVPTAPMNQEKRDTLRLTWGNTYLFSNRRTAIIFLVGITRHKDEQRIIDEEYKRYGDIVQGDFIDDYRNLTYKAILGLQFISSYCSHVPYTIKSDDDVFANIFKIMQLTEERGPRNRFLVCFHWHGMMINRPGKDRSYERWWLPLDVLPGKKVFEPYCAGLGWIFTTNIAKELVKIAYTTPFSWIDDAYISGIVMNQVKNLTVTNLWKIVDSKSMFNDILPFNASDYVFTMRNPKIVKQYWNNTLHQLGDDIVRELNITALTQYPALVQRRKKLVSGE